MVKAKCKISDALMKRAIAFEICMGEKLKDTQFYWENSESAGYVATYSFEINGRRVIVEFFEHETLIYCCGYLNRWNVSEEDPSICEEFLWKGAQYQYLKFFLEQEAEWDKHICVSAECYLPALHEHDCPNDVYAKIVETVIDKVVEEANEFTDDMEVEIDAQ